MKLKLLILLSAALIIGAGTKYAVSSALPAMSRSIDVVKTVNESKNEKITFSEKDFDESTGIRINSITVLSLPETGKLSLDTTDVTEGQIISRNKISDMSYTFSDTAKNDSFEFGYMSMGIAYTSVCRLYSIDTFNFAPVFSPDTVNSITAALGSTYYGSVYAKDPEGDSVTYGIKDHPENAVLTIIDENEGTYKYKPNNKYAGEDVFTLYAKDCYGNISDEFEVRVNNIICKDTFIDMKGNKAENAARILSEMEIMGGEKVGSINSFSPSGYVTRKDFLVMAVCVKGIDLSEYKSVSVFADDSGIDPAVMSYISFAASRGYIDDDANKGIRYFRPDDNITVSEALSMVENIFGTHPIIEASAEDYLKRDMCAALLADFIGKQ